MENPRMAFGVVGLNHLTAPLAMRERLAVLKTDRAEALSGLHACVGTQEAVLLSTCNRWEVYGAAPERDTEGWMARAVAWAAERMGESPTVLDPLVYRRTGLDAFRHLVRVGAGLDSMVLGEAQIFGQVKDAYQFAADQRSAGPLSRRVFSKSFSVVKRLRTDTAIGQKPVSVSSVAVDVAERIFGSLETRSVLLIGSGKISEVTARALALRGARSVSVTGRREEQARAIADQSCGWVLPWDQLGPTLAEVDIAMVATGAPHHLLTAREAGAFLKKRHGRPVLLVDLSVPRNIDPELGNVEGVFLYNMDDLQRVAQGNAEERARHAARAETMVEEAMARAGQDLLGWVADPVRPWAVPAMNGTLIQAASR